MARQRAVLLMTSARWYTRLNEPSLFCTAKRADAPVDADDRAHRCEGGLDVLAHRIASSSLRAGLAREELECDGSPSGPVSVAEAQMARQSAALLMTSARWQARLNEPALSCPAKQFGGLQMWLEMNILG